MSVLEFRLATVACLIICLSGKISANFRKPSSFPSDPNDKYYKAFQNVSRPQVIALKLMANFLHMSSWYRSYIEDIVIVMDGSGSVARCDFNKGKKALQHMMELAYFKNSVTKYAAVTFASSVTVNFKFLPYCVAANETTQISYPDGGTNTQAGLAEAKKLFDDPSSGRRELARRRMVLLVTDGQSNEQQQLTIPNAQALKRSGVQIFVVAVGSHINGIDELVKVASYPPEHFMFRVNSLEEFWEVIKLGIKYVSPLKYSIVQLQNDPPC